MLKLKKKIKKNGETGFDENISEFWFAIQTLLKGK